MSELLRSDSKLYNSNKTQEQHKIKIHSYTLHLLNKNKKRKLTTPSSESFCSETKI